MAQEQTISQPFSDVGRQSIETVMDMQRGFLDAFQEINRQ